MTERSILQYMGLDRNKNNIRNSQDYGLYKKDKTYLTGDVHFEDTITKTRQGVIKIMYILENMICLKLYDYY